MPLGGALTAAAIAGPVVGGIIGNMAASEDREAAMQAAKEAMAIIDAVGAPPDLSKEILIEKFKQVGILTPQLENEVNLGFSKVAQVQEDPSLRSAQIDALSSLKELGKTGLRSEDRAALADIQSKIQQDVEAKRQQIIQNLQSRGQAGGGAELAASLAASQSGAQAAADQGRQVASMASQRALQAMMQQAGLAGNVRSQDFDVATKKASAEDYVNQFNTQNAISRQNRNLERMNQAAASNLNVAQNISDANINAANREKYRQVEAQRQFWQDKLEQARAKAGARTGMIPMYQQQAAQTAQMWQNIGSGVGQGAAALYGYNSKQAPTTSSFNVDNAYVPSSDSFQMPKFGGG